MHADGAFVGILLNLILLTIIGFIYKEAPKYC